MSLAHLKRNRTDVSKLVSAAQDNGGEKQSNGPDERMWIPTRDKAGNGYAIIRFLPPPEGNDLPWARYWDHAFKGPTGQWYIERSLTSIGQQDPLGEANAKLWNSGNDADKAIVRERKRNLRYVANILVLHDPANPENEGKVKMYRFGKKIFDKIMDAMQPQYEEPVNPFDLWEGADFVLKIKKVDGYPNYDSSMFKPASPLHDGDEAKLEEIYAKTFDLSEFTDPANYKTYDELKARLNIVLGETAPRTVQETVALDEVAEPAPIPSAEPATAETTVFADDDDDTMDYFKRLAQDD